MLTENRTFLDQKVRNHAFWPVNPKEMLKRLSGDQTVIMNILRDHIFHARGGICIWSASYPGNAASMRLGAVPHVGTLSRGSGVRWTLVDFLHSPNGEQATSLCWSPTGRYPINYLLT
ncbi:hypothetical protein Taro_038572 [Colocasia esculenta]|uniref:Uncharacterized protein n=1 Tax=Colocasia esculenta TaxID=4460 RepID=A0A843WP20_COLES|nr:hypothetical protein [Colocasia esculenta]